MEKLYDNIHIGKLIERAKEYGYPIRTFALGIQMHLAPRIVKAHDNPTMCKQPSNGIIAGCTQSNKFARVLLFPILRDIYEGIPGQMLRSFVDDISQAQHGPAGSTLNDMKRGAMMLASGLIGSRCKISGKSKILASNKKLRDSLVKYLKEFGLNVESVASAKDLGAGFTAGVNAPRN